MSEYFIAVWSCDVSKAQEKEINKRLADAGLDIDFTRHYAPGDTSHGWLSRDNDGTNDYGFRRKEHDQAREIANSVLDRPKGKRGRRVDDLDW